MSSADDETRTEAIKNFCSITQADEELASTLLESCDWNVELAINMHVDSNNKPTTTSQHDTNNVRPPIAPFRQVLVDSLAEYSPEMPQNAHTRYSTRSGPAPAYDAFRDFQAETQWQESARQEGEPTNSDSMRHSLHGLYMPPLDLMTRGALSSARELGTTSNKWLLVNIQNNVQFTCHILNRDIWSNSTIKKIIKDHFIFWQVYSDSFEGSKYGQFYHVSSYPHISVIDPRTGELVKSLEVTKLNENTIEHNTFCDSLIEFLSEHPSPDGSGDCKAMKKMRVEEVETSHTLYDQSEEAQLEAAIKASLQEVENSNSSSATGNNTILIDEDSCTNDLDDSDMEQPPSSNRVEQEQVQQKQEQSKSSLPVKQEEPEEDYKTYLGTDSDKFSDLVVRFPDGTREKFKFPADSKMKALFLLLTSRGYSRNQYNYVTNFPRRLLHELPEMHTLTEAGLVRETIFVERQTSDDTTK